MLNGESTNKNNSTDISYKFLINEAICLSKTTIKLIKQYDSILNINREIIKNNETIAIYEFSFDCNYFLVQSDLLGNGEYNIKQKIQIIKELDSLLNKYLINIRKSINNNHLILLKISNPDVKHINYHEEKKLFDNIKLDYDSIYINKNNNNLFEHAEDIMNIYKLITKIIISINLIIFSGETLKKQIRNFQNSDIN